MSPCGTRPVTTYIGDVGVNKSGLDIGHNNTSSVNFIFSDLLPLSFTKVRWLRSTRAFAGWQRNGY